MTETAARPGVARGALRRRVLPTVVLLAVALGSAWLLWPGGPDVPSVLLVTIDTTRADHLGAYGYPHVDTPTLDALAAEGVRYERCYAPVPLTLPSHASLMTGLLPPRHGVRVNGVDVLADEAQTLAERLQQRGYATGAVVAAFVLDSQFGPKRTSKSRKQRDAPRSSTVWKRNPSSRCRKLSCRRATPCWRSSAAVC